MKNCFMNAEEIAPSSKKMSELHFEKIKEVKKALPLECDGLSVGDEYYIIPSPIEQDTEIVKGIKAGYVICTDFMQYDPETGEVDSENEPIFLTEAGKRYYPGDYVSIYDNIVDAEDFLKEVKNDIKED